MTRHGLVATTALLLTLLVSASASGGPPAEELKVKVGQVLSVLEDRALRAKEKTAERQLAIRSITNDLFDWREMAQQALGAHWQDRSEADRQEFVDLFRSLLERTYISQIERYSGERITYAGEFLEGDQAAVRTKIVTRHGGEVPVDYLMLRRENRWLIYDVVIAEVSLVGNYRAQFAEIMRTSSYGELVGRIRQKIKT